MLRMKDISNSHQCGKGHKVISKQTELHHSTVRNIIHKWKMSQQIHHKVHAPKIYSSDCAGLS